MTTVTEMMTPLTVGGKTMKNRFVVSALTRLRASDAHVPTDDMVEYYAQRAGYGLILTEATMMMRGYSAFAYEAGIYSATQVKAWKRVTDAVHERGGLIFCQLCHGGRSTVASNVMEGMKVSAPSHVGITQHQCIAAMARDGKQQPYPVHPHKLTVSEIADVVQAFVAAAQNAIEAGFDGVQIHGANSYLVDQFLKESANKRTDEYGGSIENRCRFLFEVVDAVIAAVGKERVALRISPLNAYNEMHTEDPKGLTQYIAQQLNSREIAFFDVMRGNFFSEERGADRWAREVYEGVMFSGMGFTIEEAEKEVAAKDTDAVCFGVLSIANPDLPARAAAGAELNAPDPSTFYTRDAKGYTDYPMMKTHDEYEEL